MPMLQAHFRSHHPALPSVWVPFSTFLHTEVLINTLILPSLHLWQKQVHSPCHQVQSPSYVLCVTSYLSHLTPLFLCMPAWPQTVSFTAAGTSWAFLKKPAPLFLHSLIIYLLICLHHWFPTWAWILQLQGLILIIFYYPISIRACA